MASNVHRKRFSYDATFDRIEEIDCKGTFIEDNSDIIQNITEYLKENGLDEFLSMDPCDEGLIEYNVNSIYGDQGTILNILHEATSHDDTLITDVATRAEAIGTKLEFYSQYLLEDKLEVRAKKLKQDQLAGRSESQLEKISGEESSDSDSDDYPSPSPSDISERIKKTGIKVPGSSRSKKVVSDASMSKTIEGIMFVGFDNNELTELPGFQEAPQLLNNLSLKMNFSSSFMNYWSAIIRSEASCAILQDAFWWFYLKHFKKDNLNLERDAFRYFCRIADSFTALFLSIDSTIRDRFFCQYAEFLCQAVYTVFYRAFPESRLQFSDWFKQSICDTIYEWILGIRAIPGSYKDWKINPDINISVKTDVKVTSTSEILAKISNLEKFLSKLGNADEPDASPEKIPEKPTQQAKIPIKKTQDKNAAIIEFYEKNESHVVREGAVVERFNFNLRGQSVLVAHYLNMRNLQENKILGPRITRSQIVKQHDPGDPTYKDIINQSMQKAKNLEDKFKELSRANEMEIRKLVREQKIAREETARLKELAENRESSTVGSLKSRSKRNSSVKLGRAVFSKKIPIEEARFETVSEFSGDLSDRSNANVNSPDHGLKSFRPSEINENLKEEDEYE